MSHLIRYIDLSACFKEWKEIIEDRLVIMFMSSESPLYVLGYVDNLRFEASGESLIFEAILGASLYFNEQNLRLFLEKAKNFGELLPKETLLFFTNLSPATATYRKYSRIIPFLKLFKFKADIISVRNKVPRSKCYFEYTDNKLPFTYVVLLKVTVDR